VKCGACPVTSGLCLAERAAHAIFCEAAAKGEPRWLSKIARLSEDANRAAAAPAASAPSVNVTPDHGARGHRRQRLGWISDAAAAGLPRLRLVRGCPAAGEVLSEAGALARGLKVGCSCRYRECGAGLGDEAAGRIASSRHCLQCALANQRQIEMRRGGGA